MNHGPYTYPVLHETTPRAMRNGRKTSEPMNSIGLDGGISADRMMVGGGGGNESSSGIGSSFFEKTVVVDPFGDA